MSDKQLLGRNVLLVHGDAPKLSGEWVAVPREDFDRAVTFIEGAQEILKDTAKQLRDLDRHNNSMRWRVHYTALCITNFLKDEHHEKDDEPEGAGIDFFGRPNAKDDPSAWME